MRQYAGLFWHVALQLDLGVYVDRVPTDGNPADDPSRGRLDDVKRRGAAILPSDLRLQYTENLKDWEEREVQG